MPSEFREYGLRFGRYVASNCRKEVIACKNSVEIGRLAGEKLLNMIASHSDYFMAYDNWREGFFDGFLDRAEQMLANKRRADS